MDPSTERSLEDTPALLFELRLVDLNLRHRCGCGKPECLANSVLSHYVAATFWFTQEKGRFVRSSTAWLGRN